MDDLLLKPAQTAQPMCVMRETSHFEMSSLKLVLSLKSSAVLYCTVEVSQSEMFPYFAIAASRWLNQSSKALSLIFPFPSYTTGVNEVGAVEGTVDLWYRACVLARQNQFAAGVARERLRWHCQDSFSFSCSCSAEMFSVKAPPFCVRGSGACGAEVGRGTAATGDEAAAIAMITTSSIIARARSFCWSERS